jgi:hypothetical protein
MYKMENIHPKPDRSARNARYYAMKKEKQAKLVEAHAAEIAVMKLLNDELTLKLKQYEVQEVPDTHNPLCPPKMEKKPKKEKKPKV